MNSASSVFAARAMPAAASPLPGATSPGCPASCRYSARMSDVERFSAALASQVILSASQPRIAAQVSVPSTATPREICTTSTTPAIFSASLASNETGLAPNCSGRLTTAVSIPGRRISPANTAVPVVLPFESSLGSRVPMSCHCCGGFSTISVGTGVFIASAASSPNVARCPEPLLITPVSTLIPDAGTFHFAAAAATNIMRAAAPTLRACSQDSAIEVLPPVPITGPKTRLL